MSASVQAKRPLALITGAGGGMGAACTRVLARRYRLLLVDDSSKPLNDATTSLRLDGAHVVDHIVGDIPRPR